MVAEPGTRRRRLSLRARITLVATAVVGLALAIGAVLFALSLRESLLGEVRAAAQRDTSEIARQLELTGVPDDADQLVDDLNDGGFVQVLGEDGSVVAASDGVSSTVPLMIPASVLDRSSDGTWTLRLAGEDGEFLASTDAAAPDTGEAESPAPIPTPTPSQNDDDSADDSNVGRDDDSDKDDNSSDDAAEEADDTDDSSGSGGDSSSSPEPSPTPTTTPSVAPGASAPSSSDGAVTVIVGRSLQTVAETTNTVSGLLGIAVPLLLLLVALTTFLVVGRALRPVEQMRRQVDEVTATNLGRRVDDPGSRDEIGRLAVTMNSMLDRLEASQRSQRQFISDASHELKSPLASLRQYAEVARSHPEKFTSAELSDAMLDEGARLERLVQGMLVLARADERSLTVGRSTLDLDDLVLREARRLRDSTDLTIDTSMVGPVRVLGDEGLLAQVVRNLADNAARHASSRIAFSLSGSRLVVEDDGGGIPEADRENVFERFVRLDDARSRDVGGSGLGLAIVREIVAAHGGTVMVSSGALGGARFVVTMPESSDPES